MDDELEAAQELTADDLLRRMRDGRPVDDDDQSWYWTDEWQAMERAAREDIAAGRTRLFESGDELIKWLESPEDDPDA